MNYKTLKEENIDKLKNSIVNLNEEEINVLFLKTCQYGFIKSFNHLYENYNKLNHSDGFKTALANGQTEIAKVLKKYKKNINYDKQIFSCINKNKMETIVELYKEKIIAFSFDHINQIVLKNDRNTVEKLLKTFKEKNIDVNLNILLTLTSTYDNNCIDLFVDKDNYESNKTAFNLACNNSLNNYKILKDFINYNQENIISMFKSPFIEIKEDSLKYLHLIDQKKLNIIATNLLLDKNCNNPSFILNNVILEKESCLKLIQNHYNNNNNLLNIVFEYIKNNNIRLENDDIFKLINLSNKVITNHIDELVLNNKTNFNHNLFKNTYNLSNYTLNWSNELSKKILHNELKEEINNSKSKKKRKI